MNAHRRALPPGATLGVLGGGQLGRMFVHAAQTLGFDTLVLDPDKASPAGVAAHHQLCAPYDDERALAEMAGRCDAVTTEFENVPAPSLASLAQDIPVAPAAAAVAMLASRDAALRGKLEAFRAKQTDVARAMTQELK